MHILPVDGHLNSMDFERNQASSSSNLYQQAASSSNAERALRSSSRIKAAKDKEEPATEQPSQQVRIRRCLVLQIAEGADHIYRLSIQSRDSTKGKSKEILPESSSTRSSKRCVSSHVHPSLHFIAICRISELVAPLYRKHLLR